MAYATLDDLRRHLGYSPSVTDDDDLLEAALAAAIEAVDAFCGRSFGVIDEDAEPEARIFEAISASRVLIDDCTEVETVEHSDDRSTWTEVADTWLEPANTDPKFVLRTSTSPFCHWVRVTGTWGYGTVPASVKSATLIKAARIFKRKDSPNGMEGTAQFGIAYVARKEDADLVLLLSPLCRTDKTLGIA